MTITTGVMKQAAAYEAMGILLPAYVLINWADKHTDTRVRADANRARELLDNLYARRADDVEARQADDDVKRLTAELETAKARARTAKRLAAYAAYAAYYSYNTAADEYRLPGDTSAPATKEPEYVCGQTHQHGNDCHPRYTNETCPCGGGSSTGPCAECGQPLHKHDDDEFGRLYLCLNDDCPN